MDGDGSRSSTNSGDEINQSTAAPSSTAELREDQIQNAVSFLSHPKVKPIRMQRVLAILIMIFILNYLFNFTGLGLLLCFLCLFLIRSVEVLKRRRFHFFNKKA
jgi:hypothetical protein